MDRRSLLTTLALGSIPGCVSSQQSPERSDTDTAAGVTDHPNSTPSPTGRPHAELSVGDRGDVQFPDTHRPISYRVVNDGEARPIRIVATTGGTTSIDETIQLPADEYATVRFNQPAEYDLQVGIAGHEPVGIRQISADEFNCGRRVGTVTVTSDGDVDSEFETTNTDCPSPRVTDTRFDMGDGECGTANTATVSVADGVICVTGRIRAPQPCYQVRLESAHYDSASETLFVIVATDEPDERICVSCLGEIPYETQIELKNDYPRTVSIQHRLTDDQLTDVARTAVTPR